MASFERTQSPGLSETQEGEVLHRKLEGCASQYYTLLKSQLEQQRIFYEGPLQELRQEHGIERKPGATKNENPYLAALRQEKRQLQQRLQSFQKKNSKVKEDVKFLKSTNESLEANKPQIEIKIQQAPKQRVESREMVQKYLPALEEKVTTLITQLEQQDTTHLVSQDRN
jgi:BRCA1-associated protein